MFDPDYTPRLYDAGGDVSKRWYIDFRVWDTDAGQFVRKQDTSMNKYRTLAERRRVAKAKLAEIIGLVQAGYTAGAAAANADGLHAKSTVLDALRVVARHKAALRSGRRYVLLVGRIEEAPYRAFASLPLLMVRGKHVVDFLDLLRQQRGYGTQAHIVYRSMLHSAFALLVQWEVLPRNPLTGHALEKANQSEQHRPYTPTQRAAVQAEIIRRGDHRLLLFISFIYYCAVRCGEELRRLQLKDVGTNTIRVAGARAKNLKTEHIALPRQLRELLLPLHLADYPPNYYLFSSGQEPGPVPVGRALLPRRLASVLKAVGLAGQQHTLYSFKHTGVISLYLATRDIELVRRHCRHAHAGITATYLRGLGALHDGDRLDAMPDF